jgi:hypothetical protein
MKLWFRVLGNLRTTERIRERINASDVSAGLESVLIDPQSPNLGGKSRLRDSEPGGGSSRTGHAPSAFHQGTLNHLLLLVE